jgi:hypothetical protein
VDVVNGFTAGTSQPDYIVLDLGVFNTIQSDINLAANGDIIGPTGLSLEDEFAVVGAANEATARLVYNEGTGVLSYRGAGGVLTNVVDLAGEPSITAADFLLQG